MTTKKLLTLVVMCCALTLSYAQDATTDMSSSGGTQYTPDYKGEVGLKLGVSAITGDFGVSPSWGVGAHYRHALDYIFSLRFGAYYQQPRGEERTSPVTTVGGIQFNDFQTALFGANAEILVSLNNMRWTRKAGEKKVDLYAGGGVGFINVDVTGIEANGNEISELLDNYSRGNNTASLLGSLGIAFKLTENVNLAVDYQAILPFGGLSDLLDGYDNLGATRTTFRDVAHFGGLSLNFNIGGDDGATEPLYWTNPMDQVISDISELKARPVFDLTDTDGDGIIDMIDQEKDSPAGAAVDTRGVTLDSDGDGIADYQDKEPYSPPGYSVDGEGKAQIPNPGYVTEGDVNRMIDAKLANFKGGGTLSDWFLPMIHFNNDSYSIRQADYGHMANIAYVLKSNPGTRLVVDGFADKTASDRYNAVLSYNRAKSAIDFLTNVHGISPDRLVLNYDGEENVLVPTNGSSFMNRRVEFKIAKGGETSMGRPEGPNAGRGTFGGTRAAGY